MKDLEHLKAKLSEASEKKSKEMEEKLFKVRSSLDTSLSAVDSSVSDGIRIVQENEGKEIPVIDLLSNGDKKDKDQIDKIITDKIATYREDTQSEEKKKKSDEALNKSFFNTITGFDEKSLPFEYDETLTVLSEKYGSRTLVSILQNDEFLPALLPSLLIDKQAQRIFVCFIKKSFNEALVMKLSSGQKQ